MSFICTLECMTFGVSVARISNSDARLQVYWFYGFEKLLPYFVTDNNQNFGNF